MLPEIGDIVTAEGDTGPVSATRKESGVVYVRLRRSDAPWRLLDASAQPAPAPEPVSEASPRSRKPSFPDAPKLKEPRQ